MCKGRMLRLLAIALLVAGAIAGGNALASTGWAPALRSVADRILPYPEVTMWAPAPEPGSHVSTYADATGAGSNYVYDVQAADANGGTRELQIIFFGSESSGSGWLEIEARGGSGVHYRACEETAVPDDAVAALGERR